MRIFNTVRSKIASVLAAGAILALVPASSAFAVWGPGRTTFTWDSPATYNTFNSITNNPVYGDERAFYDAKDVNSNTYLDQIQVHDNQELVFRIYFHNDGASNLSLSATNTKVKVLFPTNPTTNTASYAYISADNANPGTVGDTVDISGSYPFTLQYVPGSAQIKTNAMNGVVLSDQIFNGSGATIGYSSLNGNVPGCAQYSGWVTFKVRVNMDTPATPPAKTPVKVVTVTKTLPSTGAGSTIAIVAGATALAGGTHYLRSARRLNKQ